ncbi:type II toxin-antitoxin system VapC family toxin [Nocardia abscessus]|uniref:type II toxin-antitoxin system VapC family toxin n=1 Tax=Nocardia TaxID=1817 RepID=UPI001893D928|nr:MULTISPECIES: type II toxin-antitoxin system VapC family toxin [Nocardia]MBF6218577.1 type II toxin-antitoxin system VapC family toxin [Nocardia abscessus]
MTSERMASGLLDTCVLIDIDEIPDDQLPVVSRISTVTLAELGMGVAAARDATTRLFRTERLQEFESTFEALPFTAEAARRFTLMAGLLTVGGRSSKPRKFDLMIGAIASIHGLPLYTRNPKDFYGLEQVLTVVPV